MRDSELNRRKKTWTLRATKKTWNKFKIQAFNAKKNLSEYFELLVLGEKNE